MNKTAITALIILMAPLAGMGIDIYAPALPIMQQALHTTSFLGGITMTLYLVGYGVGIFCAGPLSDSFGRVKVLMWGLSLYLLFTALLIFFRNIQFLLLFRFLQGAAVAGPGVMYKVLISDLYEKNHVPKMANNASIAWALGPVVAPFVGGFLAHHLSWQACFWFLFIYDLFLLLLVKRYLSESNPDFISFSLSGLLRNYFEIISNRAFLGLITCLSVAYGAMALFNVTAPFLIQRSLGYTAIVYGTIALLLGLAYFLGVSLNRLLVHRFNPKRLTYAGAAGFLIGATALLVTALMHVTNLFIITGCLLFSYFFNGFILPNIIARCILFFPNNAGSVNAVMNGSFVLGVAILSVVGSHLPYGNQMPLAIVYVSMFTLLVLILYWLRRQT